MDDDAAAEPRIAVALGDRWVCVVLCGAIADALEELVGSAAFTPRGARLEGVDLRLGPPWPAARCARCGASRHCTPPRNAVELDHVRIALVQFAVEHEHPPRKD